MKSLRHTTALLALCSLLGITTGCGKQAHFITEKNALRNENRDGDLVPDRLEYTFQRNESVAELPVIKIVPLGSSVFLGMNPEKEERQFTIGAYDTGFNKVYGQNHSLSVNRRKIVNQASLIVQQNISWSEAKEIYMQNLVQVFAPGPFQSEVFKNNFSKDLQYKLKSRFNLEFNHVEHIEEMAQIQLGIYIVDAKTGVSNKIGQNRVLNDRDARPMMINVPSLHRVTDHEVEVSFDLDSSTVEDLIASRSYIAFSIENFQIKTLDGEDLTFQELKKRIESVCTKVLISTPEFSDVSYLAFDYTLKGYLYDRFRTIDISEYGEVNLIGDYSSNAEFPADFENMNDSDHGRWFFSGASKDFSSYSKSSLSLIYLQKRDLYRFSKAKNVVEHGKLKPYHFSVGSVVKSDLLTIKVSGRKVVHSEQIENRSKQVSINYSGTIGFGGPEVDAMAARQEREFDSHRKLIVNRTCYYDEYKKEMRIVELGDHRNYDLLENAYLEVDGVQIPLAQILLSQQAVKDAYYITFRIPHDGKALLVLNPIEEERTLRLGRLVKKECGGLRSTLKNFTVYDLIEWSLESFAVL